jgi:Holliday junction DNA helicase RuvA
MLERLRGKLIEKSLNKILVETGGGLGLSLTAPLSTSLKLPPIGEEVILETRLILRQESVELFGFLTKLERESFDILTSVSKIGPKLAVTIISAIGPKELSEALISQDPDRLSSIKGIGIKTAERIMVELKDKAKKFHDAYVLSGSSPSGSQDSKKITPSVHQEASLALQSLGHTKPEADKVIRRAAANSETAATVEDLIREALKSLSS